jgi:hypothetical protein
LHRSSAYFEASAGHFLDTAPRYGPPPHESLKISQLEHGGNGEAFEVVNQWLPPAIRIFTGQMHVLMCLSRPNLLQQILSQRRL